MLAVVVVRLVRAVLGALRPAQPQPAGRTSDLLAAAPAMEAGGWYGPCCSILQSKAIHATIDPPTPSWLETYGSGSRPTLEEVREEKKRDAGKKKEALCQQMEQLIRGY